MRFLAVTLILSLVAFTYAAELLHADSPDVIPNEYIIVLNEGVDKWAHIITVRDDILLNADSSVKEEVTGDFGIGSFQGFFATLSASKLAKQLASPNVKYVEANKVVTLNYQLESVQQEGPNIGATQTGATWGLARVSSRANPGNVLNYHYNATANSEVDAYIIDTGILTTHVDFGGRALLGYNAITGEANTDLNGHGTHVAGTVAGRTYGIHKTATLHAVKVLNAQGSGTNAGVVAGINWVASNKRPAPRRSVANMSLGGGASTATDNAVTAAVNAGIAFAVAAGNDNQNACNYSPARVPAAVGVGATSNTDARASFSNWGTCVKVFAPGQSITSDWIGSSNSATSTISGTSMASPHVCGVLALHREVAATAAPAALSTWIIDTATTGLVTNPGTGSPNRLLYSPYVH